ncbi:MAG: glycosyltransferase family 4 protein [Candidatus Competibacteraceae bacterium]|nr:glycosyltransferase family 4 protein [Candidatus Competibacteraceae bacterium]MBK8964582.1 glycosyltransferase family 4 protein [Candidatus Competibacteraceae bacterium]
MKIVIVIAHLSLGGAERVTSHLASAWARRGWEVTVVTLASPDLDFYILDQSVRRIGLDLSGNSNNLFQAITANLRRLMTLRRIFRTYQPDLVLGMMTEISVLTILANTGLSNCVLISERNHPPRLPLGRVWNWLRRRVYPLATRVIALTNETSQWLQAHAPGCQVTVIPNPVSFPLPITEPILIPRKVVPEQRRILLAVGRLAEQKGFNHLIESFASIAARWPDWDLVILGEGPKRPVLEAQINALGLNHRVKLPGRAGNVTDWYQQADLYVMSSLFEGFPNTLVEAMAHGCPAVSFDCDTGPRDIIRHKIDGLLVPAIDGPALAEALNQLMSDPRLLIQYGNRAIDVRQRFSMERILGLWDCLFEEVVSESTR